MKYFLIITYLLIVFTNCSKDFVGDGENGGGTETVIGTVIDSLGIPIKNAIVKMVSQDYYPVDLVDSLQVYIDTTDSNGQYSFSKPNSDVYNLFVYSKEKSMAFVNQGIEIFEDLEYSFVNIIKKTGVVEIILPDTTFMNGEFIFIPGTDIVNDINIAQLIDSSFYKISLNNIPASIYSSILMTQSNTDKLKKVSDEFEVNSNDTAVISAYLRWEAINTQNSNIPCDIVFDMSVDNEGKFWFATDAGVGILNNGEWELFNTYNSGLPSNFVYSMAFASTGEKWFGTSNGLVCLKDGVWFIYNDFNSELPDNIIHKVFVDNSGNVIVGTHNGAVIINDGIIQNVFTTENSDLPNGEVYCVAEDSDSAIWFGTDGGGIGVYKSGVWKIYNTNNSALLSDYIFELKTDDQNRMMIGSNEFIAFVKNDVWDVVDIIDPSGEYMTISKIAQESSRVFWLGSYHQGYVIRYDVENGMTFYNPSNTIMSSYVDMISEIIIDANNDKWISTCSGGVYILSELN